jgi:hypothetical protein
VICPNCHVELDLQLVNRTGTPEVVATVRLADWEDEQQAALLREAQRGEKDDPTW